MRKHAIIKHAPSASSRDRQLQAQRTTPPWAEHARSATHRAHDAGTAHLAHAVHAVHTLCMLTALPLAAHSAFQASQPFMRGISTHTEATRDW